MWTRTGKCPAHWRPAAELRSLSRNPHKGAMFGAHVRQYYCLTGHGPLMQHHSDHADGRKNLSDKKHHQGEAPDFPVRGRIAYVLVALVSRREG